nr:FG-GAP repeat protein [Desulfovibrio sp. JC010]
MILSLIVLGVILSPVVCSAALPVELIKKLNAVDSIQEGARFGGEVVFNGDTIVIGADGESFDGLVSAGAVYIYSKDEGGPDNWGLVKRITANDLSAGAAIAYGFFGSVIDLSEDYLVISNSRERYEGENNAGTVYVLDRKNDWGLIQVLHDEPLASSYRFGMSVAISGGTIVVGQSEQSAGFNDAVGSVCVFDPDPDNPGQWKLVQKLFPQNEGDPAYTHFGCSVSLTEAVLAVGARGEKIGANAYGAVYLYDKDSSGEWRFTKKVRAQNDDGTSDLDLEMRFGSAVDLSGDLLIVGAPERNRKKRFGAAYIYSKDKGGADQWGGVKKLTAVLESGTPRNLDLAYFGCDVSISGDLALIASHYGAYLFSKSQSDIGSWGIAKTIGDFEAEPDSKIGSSVFICGDYSLIGSSKREEKKNNFFGNPPLPNSGAAYYFKIPNIVSPEGCADKTVSPTATQPTGTSAIVTSVTKKVKTTAEVKKEHQSPGMDSMLGANVYEFTASVTAGKVAYFCFNSSSLGERAAEDVALFKLFPDKESKSFTYSSGKNPSEEGYFWITDEGNSGQYIDPKMILEGARTYTVNYSVKDNGDYDLDDTPGVINDPVVPGTSGGSGGTGCVLNPQAGMSVELCGLFVVGLLGICARRARR